MSAVNTPDEPSEMIDEGAVIDPEHASLRNTEPSSGAGLDNPGKGVVEDQPAEGSPVAEVPKVPRRLAFTSVPALLTALVLSVVLFISVLYGWYAIGPEIRSQISGSQAITLAIIALAMLAIMMSLGYSRLYADERGVIIRNGPVRRKFAVEQVAGLRLRDGDPWAYLLVKDGEGGVKRRAVLAIQQLEGVRAKRKVTSVRRWLKANGASSKGITLNEG